MTAPQVCAECGTVWPAFQTCPAAFHQLLAWEAAHPALGDVHHLMVLGYHLQHPHLYSPAGLAYSKELLIAFVVQGVSPQEIRRRARASVDSRKRKWKITGTPESHGAYTPPIRWALTIADVVARGAPHYCASVRAWAAAVHADLQATSHL